MKRIAVFSILLGALLVAGAALASDSRQAGDLQLNPPNLIGPTPLPPPVDPPAPPMSAPMAYEFQFVGVTPVAYSANHGVLNHSMACQASFAGSRMCTVEDIQRTVETPTAASYGHAWVQPKGMTGPTLAPHGGPMSFELPDASILHCRGWISNWSSDHGMVIDLGPETACYGGVHAMSCDNQLSVACCALRPVRTVLIE